ncbi:c-type heme family protein [Psychromonas aquimarina]|uniref:ATP-binding protein n=1 Tax=Psychromonas aquimarina TaxID=444919 RepID=UPI00041BAFA9|nr:DUF3365 domain-containing protein [Psychromonas aquimarina]
MRKGIYIAVALWSLTVIISLFWNISVDLESETNIARQGAQAFFKQVVLTRQWNANHGGVYVPVSEIALQNHYLKDPKRDVVTTDGIQLTKINPAYMTRQISEIALKANNIQFHITSLKPIRPENEAAPWESSALRLFEEGVQEWGAFHTDDSGLYSYRYIAPLKMMESCMKCHEQQGYKVGDVRGGISVTLLLKHNAFQWELWVSHSIALLSGILGLLIFGRHIQQSEKKLIAINHSLQDSIDELKTTQTQLVESEKMASLGNLVAGVAHEINTPVGNGLTATSHLQSETEEFVTKYKENQIKKSDLEKYIHLSYESLKIILHNLNRAGNLVKIFKQVSVDESYDQLRRYNVEEYLKDIMMSIKPVLKGKSINIQIDCDDKLEIYSYPGALAQVLINLINNSVIYGFPEEKGCISIKAYADGKAFNIHYQDDGIGMTEEVQSKVFDPFYTTSKQKGKGLGMSIVYNLITQKLQGTITCRSLSGHGVEFMICYPMEHKD